MILNISEAANLALHALSYMATHPQLAPAPTHRVAKELNVSDAHLSKVFQRLNRAGLVRSVRGPRGGFVLARPPREITLLHIYEAIDGPLSPVHHCLMGNQDCKFDTCVFGGMIHEVHEQVATHFSRTTLADLMSHSTDS